MKMELLLLTGQYYTLTSRGNWSKFAGRSHFCSLFSPLVQNGSYWSNFRFRERHAVLFGSFTLQQS